MLTEKQATVIAGAINLLSDKRWSSSQLMAVMGDTRIRDKRTPAQVASAFAYLALDPATRQPTRALDDGPWWGSAAQAPAVTPTPRRLSHTDCRECFRPEADHGIDPTLADHEYEPWLTTGAAAMPADLRAAIDAARNTPPPKRNDDDTPPPDSTTDESEQ